VAGLSKTEVAPAADPDPGRAPLRDFEQAIEGRTAHDPLQQDVSGVHGELKKGAIAKTAHSHAIDEELKGPLAWHLIDP